MTAPRLPSPSTGVRRSVAGSARFWSVHALIITLIVIELVMIIGHDPAAPTGRWLWPAVAAAAAICWIFSRSRPGAVLLLIIQVFVLWSRVLFPGSPAEEKDGRVLKLDQALLAEGSADLTRCLAAGIALLACVLAFVPIMIKADAIDTEVINSGEDGRRPSRILGLGVGLLVAALVVGVAVPSAYGLRAISRTRVISSAEDSRIIDHPNTTGSSPITVGDRSGWSRTTIVAAQPAGDRVIAIEAGNAPEDNYPPAHAIVGLRSTDGAVLWRYRVGAGDRQDAVGPAVIDPAARMIMVVYRSALIGLDFDGRVRYRKPLAESIDPTEQPVLVGDVLGDAGPTLQLGSVAVFGGNYAGQPGGFATGYAVATGVRLWQYTAETDRCEFARAAGPGNRVYLLTGGRDGCAAKLIAYDGPTRAFAVALRPPQDYVDAYATADIDTGVSDVTPSIAAVGADRVTIAPLWWSGRPLHGRERPTQQLTQLFDTAGKLLGTLPAGVSPGSVSPTRLLPTPLATGWRSPLGIVVMGPPKSDGQFDRWLTLSPSLRPTAATTLPSGSGYQRVGPLLISWPWGGKGSSNDVTVHRIGARLAPAEQLDPDQLSGCAGRISWISADDTRMAVRCRRTILVVPL